MGRSKAEVRRNAVKASQISATSLRDGRDLPVGFAQPRLGAESRRAAEVGEGKGGYEFVDIVSKPSVAGRRFHFIGAGGVGMSGLAKVLLKNKAIVTGSDQAGSSVLDGLCEAGADIRVGHDERHLSSEAEAVVISAAISEDNPELRLARERGCKIYKYAELLGVLFNRYDGIAVAGTHGKSTTSGWLTFCLQEAGFEPNFIIGAELCQLGASSGVGDGRVFVAEACEYDRSFLNLRPRIACVLNIEEDHLDYYKDEDEIIGAFGDFTRGIRPDGVLIANGQDANVAEILAAWDGNLNCETFGLDVSCNFSARNIELSDGLYRFEVYYNDRLLGAVRISLHGIHNVLNALAVVAMGIHAGLSAEQVLRLVPEFVGMDRRLMLKAEADGMVVLDDYAHHPTEIRASLQAIRERYQPHRVWCVFQPHQYSRTRFLLDDFAESFKLADITIVPEIYFVRDSQSEKKQINSAILAERIRGKGSNAIFIDGFGRICDHLKENVAAGDVVVTMGAGDIWKVADEYIQWLGRNS
jgi:UDP-N-acetylmuramate--alanine ligase